MASSRDVLRRNRKVGGYSDQLLIEGSKSLYRLREAVECYKRALIPADPREITINLRLAKIHRSLDELSESVAYHRRVVEVCQADRKTCLLSPTCLSMTHYFYLVNISPSGTRLCEVLY